MDLEEFRASLEKRAKDALAAAGDTPRRATCDGCQKKRRCRARPSGLAFTPVMWVCRKCWSYAQEIR